MFGLFKQRPPIEQLAHKIRWVAETIHQPEVFARRAKHVASELGSDAIPELAKQFYGESTPRRPNLLLSFPGGSVDCCATTRNLRIFYYFREALFLFSGVLLTANTTGLRATPLKCSAV